ncbi:MULTISPECIES: aminotransferase class I/II-fold pyridoxal phosphate-dependent enzyme [Microbacterium]|uniref:aminotransferase class I/II-fold pyridoxal phosphate-dependent enzyme n=1 Tax=Microbacterium TaxID=33882 RepID=UPI00217EFA29|nr:MULTISPECIES: PLP-dependent transferase [Microbacterium]UWF77278.1 PLP-dependent transferase [Microbacterium neungamense]WCM55435.1 PLP-dependent transferase [Microbacterium sp. EF45047]
MTSASLLAPAGDRTESGTSSTPYADALARYAARDTVRLNVPGHSADPEAVPQVAEYFGRDVLLKDVPPLLAGLDKGEGNPLAQSLRLAAEAFGARRTWFLTNGASQANRIAALALAGFRAQTAPVVVQRSAHSSFSDGIILGGLSPRFVQPSIDGWFGINHGVSPASLREALGRLEEHERPKGVYVISPSYFGAVADIAGLAEVAHEAGAPLIVDAAWGAHFGFHEDVPENPLRLGADLVVSSTHKLGGSLTQSAMLHLGDGPFADELEPLVERAFRLEQSTSESSLLLASLDLARDALQTGRDRIGAAIAAADELRDRIRRGRRFRIVSDTFDRFDDIVAADPLRVSIDVASGGVHGPTARELLMEQDGVYFEIATETCLVAVVAPGVVPDVARVVDALHALPVDADAAADVDAIEAATVLPEPGPLAMLPRDAFLRSAETVDAADAVGRVSAAALAAYPPGIPNVLPGEVITEDVVRFLQRVAATPGGYVRGAADPTLATLSVVR